MIKESGSYRLFSFTNNILLTILAIVCVLPLIHVLAVSFSSSGPANAHAVGLVPVDFTAENYRITLQNTRFIRSMFWSVYRLVLGTGIHMVLICLTAYPLSKSDHAFKGRSVYAWLFVFTMLFSGGLIPQYLVIRNLGLMNTIGALVLPRAMSVWSMILLINFFRTVPKDLEDAALIDGAGQLRTLVSIFVPLSKAALATLGLFHMVFQWNSWFDGLIYMSTQRYPLATFLQTVVVRGTDILEMTEDQIQRLSQRGLVSSQIFIAAVPILMVYPFLQKYFVKGIVLGSVKG